MPTRNSLKVASQILRERGFEILGENIPVQVSGFQVSDIDLLARGPDGLYAVEVKSGKLDVGGVRQAYVNALIMKAKPLIVCRGFSDPSARALAEEMRIEVILLEDIFLSDPEELRALIREEVRSAIMEVLPNILAPPHLNEEERKILKAIADSLDFFDAARRLNIKPEELGRILGKLRGENKIPKWTKDYQQVKSWAGMLLNIIES